MKVYRLDASPHRDCVAKAVGAASHQMRMDSQRFRFATN